MAPKRADHCTHPNQTWCDCDWCRVNKHWPAGYTDWLGYLFCATCAHDLTINNPRPVYGAPHISEPCDHCAKRLDQPTAQPVAA